uniref:RNA exonuclease 4 n=1 Tax=Pinguiococcus pyrenoidosus TaxID=172671 RepID=A0A7R9UBH6_9STRA
MVGVGVNGRKSVLARATLVDASGSTIYDQFVRPRERVTDFRTFVSGVTPRHLKHKKAKMIEEVQEELRELLRDKIVVGHALQNDFRALGLRVPPRQVRDTATYRAFMRTAPGQRPRPQKLKDVCKEHLGLDIQDGQHDSAEDARGAMLLYRSVRGEWERTLQRQRGEGGSGVKALGLSQKKTSKLAIAKARSGVRRVNQVSGKKRKRDSD